MTDNLGARVVQRVTERADGLAQKIADQIGAPADASKLSRTDQQRLWNLPNPQADPMQVQQLIAAGQHSQAVDLMFPWRNRLIGQGDPQTRVQRAQQLANLGNVEHSGNVSHST